MKLKSDMKEKWKSIQGYKGIYKVSNLGRILSLSRRVKSKAGSYRRTKERILKPYKNRDGYLKVDLRKNGTGQEEFLHRLVAKAFIQNPYNLPEVNHKWGNKLDNRAKSLEWISRENNLKHAHSIGLMPKGEAHSRSKPVVNCRGEVFTTLTEAAKFYRLKTTSSITKVLTSGRKSAGKYPDGSPIEWKYYIE